MDVPGAEALQAVVSSLLVPLQVRAGSGFRARIDHADAGPLVVAGLRGGPHTVARRARAISSTDADLMKLVLQRRGGLAVSQDEHRSRLQPGDLVVCDTGRPYEVRVPDVCDVVVVGIPRTMLGPGADLVGRRAGTALPTDRGTGALIGGLLTGLADHLAELPGSGGLRLADAVISLLVAAFTATSPERVETATDLTDRILTYALANLADPTLSSNSVAARHGISVRHLQKLLARRGITFTTWVRTQRLERVRHDLRDPALAEYTAAVIAARWGLHDPAHLARALKRHYGQTATELRRSAS